MSPLILLIAACAPPPTGDAFTTFSVDALDPAETHERFVRVIDQADDTLDVALPSVEDTTLSDAIIAAHEGGVSVRVTTDFDNAAQPGVQALLAAGVPTTLADDGITYFDFNSNTDVQWGSGLTIMSEAWAIADLERGVVATEAGTMIPGTRVVFDITGEDLLIDMESEHNQVFGGSDATSVTAYDNLAKSIADARWAYPTSTDHVLEVWFGPQERLTKRMVDAIYTSKASVRVLTNDFSNEGMSDALQDKAELGFVTEVIVGPAFESSGFFQSQELRTSTPDVPKLRVCGNLEVPTVMLVDYEEARNGQRYPARAFVLTHDVYSATRLFQGAEVTSDQLIDGALLVVDDYDSPSGAMDALAEVYTQHRDVAVGGLSCP